MMRQPADLHANCHRVKLPPLKDDPIAFSFFCFICPAMFGLAVLGLVGLVVLIVGLVVAWIIASIPVYFAAKLITSGKAGLGQAMVATLLGTVVYAIVSFLFGVLLSPMLGSAAPAIATFAAFLVWVLVYKTSFSTRWLQAVGIAILASVIVYAFNAAIAYILGTLPSGIF